MKYHVYIAATGSESSLNQSRAEYGQPAEEFAASSIEEALSAVGPFRSATITSPSGDVMTVTDNGHRRVVVTDEGEEI